MLVPNLRFNQFNNSYTSKKLSDIAKIVMGQSPDSKNYTFNTNATLLIQGNADLANGKIKPRIYTSSITKMCAVNDIIMTVRAPVGDLAISQYDACIGRGVCLIRGTKYLYYYLESFKQRGGWKKISKGSTIDSITSDDLKNININLPNNIEQSKISNFLTLLDKKIELQKRKIGALKIYKRGLIQKLYDQKYNNKIKMKNIIKQKSIRNTNNEIKDIYSVNNKEGFVLQTDQFKDRIVASEDTTNYKIVKKDYFAYNPARINVGSIARMKHEKIGIISPMYICFECKNNVLPEYLEYFFETDIFTYEIKKRLEGSVRICLSYESMLNIPIDLPDIIQQERISKVLNEFDKRINCEKIKYDYQKRLKDALLQKMFI